ncbi:hypothetical protein Q4S26_22145, partial [Morganella morganii]
SSSFYPHNAHLTLPQQYGDPVNLFWASPVFTAERQLAHATPNGGHDLVHRLREQGVDHILRPRQPVCRRHLSSLREPP